MGYPDASNELDRSLWLQTLHSLEDFVVIICECDMYLSTVSVGIHMYMMGVVG